MANPRCVYRCSACSTTSQCRCHHRCCWQSGRRRVGSDPTANGPQPTARPVHSALCTNCATPWVTKLRNYQDQPAQPSAALTTSASDGAPVRLERPAPAGHWARTSRNELTPLAREPRSTQACTHPASNTKIPSHAAQPCQQQQQRPEHLRPTVPSLFISSQDQRRTSSRVRCIARYSASTGSTILWHPHRY
jgi:hypothetical protein